jgi:hypothetical protein
VCHGVDLTATGPHGINHTDIKDSKSDTEIKIYPNPATNILYIQNRNSIENIRIYNTQGKLIDIKLNISIINHNELKLNIENFTSGVYIIKIGNSSKKFIKH